MTEIQEQPNPTPTILIPEKALWAVIYWTASDHPLPCLMYSSNKQEAINWANDCSTRDPDKPMKLYKLEY
jgi:hypothetical protein